MTSQQGPQQDPKTQSNQNTQPPTSGTGQGQTQDELQKKVEEAQKEAEAKEAEEQGKADESQALQAQVEELKNALARTMADWQNFKRRSEEERVSFVKFANVQLLKELLPVLNNLQRSVAHLPQDLKENDWAKGVVGVHDDMLKTLEKVGVKKIESVGKPLDPNLHEALMSGPGEKNVVVEEFEAGYQYHDQVIWPAKVKVGDGS